MTRQDPISCPWCGDNGAPGCDGRCEPKTRDDDNTRTILAYLAGVAVVLVALFLVFMGATDGKPRKAQLVVKWDDSQHGPWVATVKPIGPAQYVEWVNPDGVVWVGGAWGPSVQCEVK